MSLPVTPIRTSVPEMGASGGPRTHSGAIPRDAQLRTPTRMGLTKGKNIFIAEEERFIWQKPINEYDAFYDLPPTIEKRGVMFGSSTRSDWENTWKNKKDTYNPNAGPGQNGTPDSRLLSQNRRVKDVKFGTAPRSIDHSNNNPGPDYNLGRAFKNGVDNRISIGFNKDMRKPLSDNLKSRTDAMYDPRLPKGKAITIAGRRRPNRFETERSPGAIYNMAKYDFKSGPSFSFGRSKAKRIG